MKKYIEPEIEIVEFDESILTLPDVSPGEDPDDGWGPPF